MSTEYLQQSTFEPRPHPGEAVRTTLLDNDEVLAVATAYAPGASAPTHTHRFPSLVYVIDGGTLETTGADGTVTRYDMHAGETLWSPAGHTHAARNAGLTPVRIVEVEVKHGKPAMATEQKHLVRTPTELEWVPDAHDPRRAAAVLIGDPALPGPFTVRYRAPAGYEMGLHFHPNDDEQLTVISGAIMWSAGAAGSGAPEHALTAGGFAMVRAGTPHRIVAVEDAVLQMSGTGPHTYVYVNAADDPRSRR